MDRKLIIAFNMDYERFKMKEAILFPEEKFVEDMLNRITYPVKSEAKWKVFFDQHRKEINFLVVYGEYEPYYEFCYPASLWHKVVDETFAETYKVLVKLELNDEIEYDYDSWTRAIMQRCLIEFLTLDKKTLKGILKFFNFKDPFVVLTKVAPKLLSKEDSV